MFFLFGHMAEKDQDQSKQHDSPENTGDGNAPPDAIEPQCCAGKDHGQRNTGSYEKRGGQGRGQGVTESGESTGGDDVHL